MSTRFLPLSILICGFGLSITTLLAEDITMIDGRVLSSSMLKRSGELIMLKIPGPDGTGIVEMGFPVARIANVNFAEPVELAQAQAAAIQGNADKVLTLTASYVNGQADFKDLPGSWWMKMAQLRLYALAGSGKDAEVAELARQIELVKSPEAKSLSKAGVLFASLSDSKSNAVEMGAKGIPRVGGGESTALVQLALGKALLFKKDYVNSLKAFLTIKVFYPSLSLLQPAALMGAGDCLIGLNDPKHAAQDFEDIINNWSNSIQVTEAKKKADTISKN